MLARPATVANRRLLHNGHLIAVQEYAELKATACGFVGVRPLKYSMDTQGKSFRPKISVACEFAQMMRMPCCRRIAYCRTDFS